jgi:4-alpha-glucanotransferase
LDKDVKSKVIKDGLKALGKKKLALIMHSGSFPALENEDTGFGSVNSSGGKKVINFAEGLFDSIQLGPAGKTKACDSSPYTGTIFSGNPLFIDLKQLTTEEGNNLLSKETFDDIVANNPNKGKNKTAYSYIFKRQNEALKEAYENFKNLKKGLIKKTFEKYKKENASWLEKDSLYEALSIENENDYWPIWKSEIDKNLLNPKNEEEKNVYDARIKEIKEKYADEIDFYAFCQFILHLQNEETKEYALAHHIKMIADRQVSFSDRDCWAYQSLFLDGWCLGCPPDYFSANGQAWGFPALDPEKMFNKDGSLGEAGHLMKELFKKMFKENPGGVRIDHIVGLIDPWVYQKGHNPKIEEGAGRLYSSPEHEFLKKYAIPSLEDLDETVGADKEKRVKTLTDAQITKYGRLIEKIVIGAAKEVGLNKDAIVCEDLGTLTNPVAAVLKKFDMLGMRLTQFVIPEDSDHPYRCKNIPPRCWAMVGTHDNEPIFMWAKSVINSEVGYHHAKNLVEDLFKDAEDKDALIVKLNTDAKFLAQTKIVELFASQAENIQIFFTDYFGIEDVYNKPGTSGDSNWSLRLPNNFAENFCEDILQDKAIDLSLIIRLAIKARGNDFEKKYCGLSARLKDV